MKRLLLVIFSIFFLTGCSHKTTDKEITFWTLQMNNFAPYINEVISSYEKLNPEIKIKWIDIPFSEGEKRTLAGLWCDDFTDFKNGKR